jgi:hypothetical protein
MIGLDMGIAYFDADVTIDDEIEKQEITHGYDGVSMWTRLEGLIFLKKYRESLFTWSIRRVLAHPE